MRHPAIRIRRPRRATLLAALLIPCALVFTRPVHAQCPVSNSAVWGQSGCGNGSFGSVRDVAVDGCQVFTVDFCAFVQVFDENGNFCRQWGEYGEGPFQFSQPWGVCVDYQGFVFVADLTNGKVMKFTNAGVPVLEWSTGVGSLPISPIKVNVGPGNEIYIADYSNQRIQVFSSAGVYLRSWGSAGSGNGQFAYPTGVAVSNSGTVYVTDNCNHRVQMFTTTGTYLGQWGTLGSGPGEFLHPTDVAVDASGNVFVVEGFDDGCEPGYNSRVQEFTPSGVYLGEWGGFGGAPGQFASPWGLGIQRGQSCQFFVADTDNRRIQRFGPSSCPPGCVATAVPHSTWGQLKARYR